MTSATLRCNIGCGQTPTVGWRNFDNSASLLLARIPFLPWMLCRSGVIAASQYAFIQFARTQRLEYADAVKGLPLANNTVEVIYSSHMFEHLDRDEASAFLDEAKRVLCPGGIIRLVVPDIAKQIDKYFESKDADTFLTSTHLTRLRPKTIGDRLRTLIVGTRHHQWMYDGGSLSKLLSSKGFRNVRIQAPGETSIFNPGSLDLYERADESVYVEAYR